MYLNFSTLNFRHLGLPPFPQNLEIMADKGFRNAGPVIVPFAPGRQALHGDIAEYDHYVSMIKIKHITVSVSCFWLTIILKSTCIMINTFRSFNAARAVIERVFGVMKSSYRCVGTRRLRNRRNIGPLICNVSAGLYNRRKIHFSILRERLNYIP